MSCTCRDDARSWAMPESQLSENHGSISPYSQPRNQQNGQSVSSHNSSTITPTRNQLVCWRVGDLRPHPSYARLGIKVPASRLNALLEMGDDAFLFPLIVTSDGIVINGYARLEIARLQGCTTVECIECNISEEEALRRLLLCHRPSPGLPPFTRIAMARGLAKSFKEKALHHQQAGGKSKGSSKLPQAELFSGIGVIRIYGCCM